MMDSQRVEAAQSPTSSQGTDYGAPEKVPSKRRKSRWGRFDASEIMRRARASARVQEKYMYNLRRRSIQDAESLKRDANRLIASKNLASAINAAVVNKRYNAHKKWRKGCSRKWNRRAENFKKNFTESGAFLVFIIRREIATIPGPGV